MFLKDVDPILPHFSSHVFLYDIAPIFKLSEKLIRRIFRILGARVFSMIFKMLEFQAFEISKTDMLKGFGALLNYIDSFGESEAKHNWLREAWTCQQI